MKKLLSFVISACLIFGMVSIPSAYAAAPEDNSPQNSKVEFLVQAGVPSAFLELRNAAEIDTLYDLAQTHTLQYSSEQILYNENGIVQYGTISEADMVLTISKLEAQSPGYPSRITSVAVFIDYTWSANHPKVQKQDAITVNWDSSLFQFVGGTFNSVDYIELVNGEVITQNAQTNPALLNLGGLGYFADLSSPYIVSNHRGSASFMLNAKYNIYVGSSNLSQVTVQYTHDLNPFLGSLSFSSNGFGVSIPAGAFQDSIAKELSIYYSL